MYLDQASKPVSPDISFSCFWPPKNQAWKSRKNCCKREVWEGDPTASSLFLFGAKWVPMILQKVQHCIFLWDGVPRWLQNTSWNPIFLNLFSSFYLNRFLGSYSVEARLKTKRNIFFLHYFFNEGEDSAVLPRQTLSDDHRMFPSSKLLRTW